MSDQPPTVVRGDGMITTIAGSVHQTIHRLDPNMLAILVMAVVLNGLFFWALRINAEHRHAEFMEALKTCPASTVARPYAGGLDR